MPFWRGIKPLVAALLAGTLVFGSPGSASYEAFAGVVTQAVATQGTGVPVVPVLGGNAGIAPLTSAAPTLGLAPGVLSNLPSLTPVIPQRGPAAAPAAANASVGAFAAPAAVSAVAAPAALALALPAAALPMARQAPVVPAALEASAPAEARGRSPKESLGALRTLKSGLSGRAAESSARLFFDGGTAAGSAPAGVREADMEAPGAPRRKGLRLMMGGGAAAAATLLAVNGQPIFSAASATSWLGVLHFVGASGYLLANVLAFAFPLPQIYKTFRHGSGAGVPVWRAAVGMTASLALGLVTAPLAGQLFWGVQNIFGALTLIAPVVIGKVLARRQVQFSPRGAASMTALTSALLAAPSYGLFVAAKAFLAPLLGSWLGGAGLCALTLGLQIATGAMFFLLFVPDILSIMKGRAPKGFTSLFSLLFFITSVGFIAWTVQMAADAPAGSSARLQYAIYAAQNAAYAVVSFLSWYHIRKGERAKGA